MSEQNENQPESHLTPDQIADEKSREAFRRLMGIVSPPVVTDKPDEQLETLYDLPSHEEKDESD